MNTLKPILIFTLIVALFSSCEDILEPQPLDGAYTDEFVWANPTYARGVLYASYLSIPYSSAIMPGVDFLAIATDDAVSNNLSTANRSFSIGQLSSSFNVIDCWAKDYELLRNVNDFLENGLQLRYMEDPEVNERMLERFRGEALFMRAYLHFKLLKYYGGKVNGVAMGIPIVTEVLGAGDQQNIVRPTYLETAQQIYADCDEAFNYLPEDYSGTDQVAGERHEGGATKGAAKTLKAITALFAASPANNLDEALKTENWENAVDYAMDAILEVDGMVNLNAIKRNFSSPSGEDVIWRGRFFSDYNLEGKNFPPSYYGQGRTNPSKDLVDAFPDYFGFPMGHAFYNGAFRDPRLGEYIFVNGATFNGEEIETFVGGKDSREVSQYGTRSGYYLKKFMAKGAELFPERKGAQNTFNPILSKTELYFALAEALNEYHQDPMGTTDGVSAKDIMTKLRKRAFIIDLYMGEISNAGYEEFQKFIRNERRVELCFEDKRFWDLRRWDTEVDQVEVHGVRITKESDGTLVEEEFVIETKSFNGKSLPIPYKDALLLENVPQNEGW
jgi:hypothetical protein